MKRCMFIYLVFFPLLTGCWKPELFGDFRDYDPTAIPEQVKSRAMQFAYRYGESQTCLIEKRRITYEPFVYLGSMPDSLSWRRANLNKDVNVFCDSVLRDHKDQLNFIELHFTVFFFRLSNSEMLGSMSFAYNDLTKYPFKN